MHGEGKSENINNNLGSETYQHEAQIHFIRMKFFNTAGPVNCQKHYCLPPLSRFDLDDILSLIYQEKYFVLHAPRQTGKTTCMIALMHRLNKEGKYSSLYTNIENAQAAREHVEEGIRSVLISIAQSAQYYMNDSFLVDALAGILTNNGPFNALEAMLTLWAEHEDLPVVLILDEIDALVGDTLISVLRQLRSGYTKRPRGFPTSIILCGVRDVRDYRIHSDREKSIITGGSAFNIKAESMRLGNFSEEEVPILCNQHTEETGQIFEPSALSSIWELTRGQPWLVNALAYETCFKMKEGRDRTTPITHEMIIEAKEQLIQRRETHLDQLTDKLKEERVVRVIEPILTGGKQPENVPEDDIWYVEDLGLITTKGQLRIANPIYQEIIPRILTYSTQLTISVEPIWYILPDGTISMEKLLSSFQQFFRENSEIWLERFMYREAGPQLLLQAYLQRIINGGGRIEREYGLGMGRTDLYVAWPLPDGRTQRIVIECKILRGSREKTILAGSSQVLGYADRCGADDVHLVIFDRAEGKTWDEKIFDEKRMSGRKVMVWGM